MRTSAYMAVTLLCVLHVCGGVGVGAVSGQEPAWKSLFDGQALTGWHAVGDGVWAVENGEIVGRANNERLYGLLVSDWAFGDFSLRLKFRCASGDSGVYVRTLLRPPDQAHGLQVQVGPPGTGVGGIYESYGRGWLVKPTAEQEQALVKPGDWNAVTITAKAGDVVVEINGAQTAEIKGDPSRPEGQLALQMHAGTVMEVRFKDIEITETR
jgi:hypothetical protein